MEACISACRLSVLYKRMSEEIHTFEHNPSLEMVVIMGEAVNTGESKALQCLADAAGIRARVQARQAYKPMVDLDVDGSTA